MINSLPRLTASSWKEVQEQGHFEVCTLGELGISRDFHERLAPSFDTLSWDQYDPRRRQLEYLMKALPSHQQALKGVFLDYYAGKHGIEVLTPFVAQLDRIQEQTFAAIEPCRKRSIARFDLIWRGKTWEIKRTPVSHFSPDLGDSNILSQQRVFPEMDRTVTDDPDLHRLLGVVGDKVRRIESDMLFWAITLHQVSIVARPGSPGDNAPEGIHQDGARYIVSAFVMERRNVDGGESRIYGPDQKTLLLKHTLQEGEFIFQSDWDSPLWHDITPVYATSQTELGVRNIFGFDIQARRSVQS